MEQVEKHHLAFNKETEKDIKNPFFRTYNSILNNFGHFLDGATFVYVNVFVRSFSAINDVKMVSIFVLLKY